jgi:hypothetical protein
VLEIQEFHILWSASATSVFSRGAPLLDGNECGSKAILIALSKVDFRGVALRVDDVKCECCGAIASYSANVYNHRARQAIHSTSRPSGWPYQPTRFQLQLSSATWTFKVTQSTSRHQPHKRPPRVHCIAVMSKGAFHRHYCVFGLVCRGRSCPTAGPHAISI